MMRLAFSNKAKYPDFDSGYDLYAKRSRGRALISKDVYKRIIREYCLGMSMRLLNDGMVDIPGNIGTLYAAVIGRKPVYRDGKFVGYGKFDWATGRYDGERDAFGVVFLPNRRKTPNLRCYGFVANRRLFKKMKWLYESDYCPWVPIEFNDEII